MNLQQKITNWNGKAIDVLQAVYDCYSQNVDFDSELVELLELPASQMGTSWLLKRYLEEGGALARDAHQRVFEALSVLEDWQTKLHVLQCLPFLTISKRDVKLVDPFLRACAESENKFVRAWAYHGFYELALQHHNYQTEVDQLLEQAMQDEAPSVRARVRNIKKDLR